MSDLGGIPQTGYFAAYKMTVSGKINTGVTDVLADLGYFYPLEDSCSISSVIDV